MRIPLDYYRILSVPVKANASQLEQAYDDRLLQQPRREYSPEAVKARQQLIQYSYQVLSNPEQRADYDAQFLLNMEPLGTSDLTEDNQSTVDSQGAGTTAEGAIEENAVPPANPTIDIAANQIVGALLILYELGEYETVLRLGIDEFNNRRLGQRSRSLEVVQSEPEDELSLDSTQEDLILVLTLAYMELGREQWHRREYENAALSGQLGIDLLQQKNLFPHLQLELEQDLCKLRPYRVLELISRNPAKSAGRAEGFRLLQAMLIQRQGIEGKGEDLSGLNFNQFLCFVQQLRTYLSSAEQQQLFAHENQEKSAIANYLAVYALLARGFSLKQPELVLQAQKKLDYLSKKQDVSWEQAIAALLLGHTEKAIDKLKHSSDSNQLQQVQQYASDSSDLLPGLCVYGEQWLLQDVLAQFSDLADSTLTLKEYFADQQVQACLEKLAPPAIGTAIAKNQISSGIAQNSKATAKIVNSKIISLWRNMFARGKSISAVSNSMTSNAVAKEMENSGSFREYKSSATATIERHQPDTSSNFRSASMSPPKSHRPPHSRKSLSLPLEPDNTRAVPESVIRKAQRKALGKKGGRKRKKRKPETLWKGWLFIISLIFGVGTLGYLGMKLLLSPPNKTASEAELAIALNRPSVEMPAAKTKTIEAKPQPQATFPQQAEKLIQEWLNSKAAVMGKEHKIDALNNILAQPMLTTWSKSATEYQQKNIYREYQHKIAMRSAKIDSNNQNKATVEAEITETAKHYQSGQLDTAQSYDDNLLVRYQLIRQGEKWLIQQSQVLKTL